MFRYLATTAGTEANSLYFGSVVGFCDVPGSGGAANRRQDGHLYSRQAHVRTKKME